ncbi:MAG: hypothetical protein ACYSX1_08495, partial [Planctomycetota bacterium]
MAAKSKASVSARRQISKARLVVCVPILLVCLRSPVSAAPYFGELFEFRQPDGSYTEVKVWGDEFYQRVESPDGYTLVRHPESRWICYAQLSSDGSELIPTNVVYHGASVTKQRDLKA